MNKQYFTDITNILVIGSGGAGLRAAIEAKLQGLSVKVIGKRLRNDVHTVLAAGGINASLGNLDEDDSWEQHFTDTFLEGYGLGNPNLIEIMAKKAPNAVLEIEKWGANFDKLNNGKLNQRYFGAHTYRRTCFSGDYTGYSILNALLKKSSELKIPINDDIYVTDLLVKDKKCFGAFSFDISTGQRIVNLADAVILCTGGHTRIWKKSSSRIQENTGDGYDLALKAGCNLIDMEMVQFHPTGILFPDEIAGTLVTEAVRGEGGKLFNNKKERFMEKYDKQRMELSTRDVVAMANYTEIMEGRGTPQGGVYLDISHKNKEFIIEKIPKIYRLFIEKQILDISKYPMEVAPTAHYSMGGVEVNSKDHSTIIKGLFAAGELAGGLHGANRLGGNSLAEILIFGKEAGLHAAMYSKRLRTIERSKEVISFADEKLNKLIKKGNEISLKLQEDLSQIMWKNCGVVKNEDSLKKGLQKINELKKQSQDCDVRISGNNNQDLINLLNLKSSIISAECTLKSALFREESRGAHQRKDFPNLNNNGISNIFCSLEENEIKVKTKKVINIRDELKAFMKDKRVITSFKGRLLE